MYDVIDHIVKGSQIEVLERAVKLLKPKGTLYIRCHPWTSRHGVHQYTKLNKAYIQFFLPPDILKKYCAEETVKILRPKRHYHKLFKGAGLKIGDCNDTTTNVDPFFRDEYITNMMLETYGQDRIASHANFHHLISMSFIDYKLKHAN